MDAAQNLTIGEGAGAVSLPRPITDLHAKGLSLANVREFVPKEVSQYVAANWADGFKSLSAVATEFHDSWHENDVGHAWLCVLSSSRASILRP
eukprot:14918-Amphidinium_carterae.1